MGYVSASGGAVFVVDDDPDMRALLQRWLENDGYEALTYGDGEACLVGLGERLPLVVCLDLSMPGLGGQEVLARIRERHPKLPVLILTADSSVPSVVEAMQAGAYDYLTKPLKQDKLLVAVRNAAAQHELARRVSEQEREVRGYPGIIGRSPAMGALYRQLDRLATSDITVLIHGESGTGKELVAQALHDESGRSAGPFVALNCAAIPEALLESELFGHEKGAFTGATARRLGKFEQADKGTLFLDEVAELSLPLQAKLLRVLQEQRFERVGGDRTVRSDFRLLAATHRDLLVEVREGRFREDLFFRIAVFELELPPLREREGDVRLLARAFLDRYGEGRTIGLCSKVVGLLERHLWPGNVRELQNVVQRALVLADDELCIEHLPQRMLRAMGVGDGGEGVGCAISLTPPSAEVASVEDTVSESVSVSESAAVSAPVSPPAESSPPPQSPSPEEGVSPGDALAFFDGEGRPWTLEDLERQAIEAAYARCEGNIARIVDELGIGRTTLYRKLKAYNLR